MKNNVNHRTTMLCPLPWIGSSVRSNGDLRVCCQANQGPKRGILSKEDGSVFNAANPGDIENSRNSSMMIDVRKHMIEGKWHEECVRCKREVESGMDARIRYENEIWMEQGLLDWDHLLNNTDEDGKIKTDEIGLQYYDIRFGNLCNLKCIMCGPTDSSNWYDDHFELHGSVFRDTHGKVILIKNEKDRAVPKEDVYSWHQNDQYWSDMEKGIPKINKLYIVGGEPLLIDRHYEFLQKCVDLGYSKNITVEYNTNLTNLPAKALSIWKHFKRINIGASVDGVGDLNYYMRPPSNFNQIHKNLKKLSEAEGEYKVWIAATVNIFNVLHLPEFIEWIIENKLPRINDDNRKPLLNPHPLHGPKHYNIRALPELAKLAVVEKYNKYRPILKDKIEIQNWSSERKYYSKLEVDKILDSYIKFMYAEDYSSELKTFWRLTRKLDSIRGNSIEEYIPELYELIKDTEFI
jgi:hypothetical protein